MYVGVDDDEVLDVGSFDDANSNEYGGVADFCFAFDKVNSNIYFKHSWVLIFISGKCILRTWYLQLFR